MHALGGGEVAKGFEGGRGPSSPQKGKGVWGLEKGLKRQSFYIKTVR